MGNAIDRLIFTPDEDPKPWQVAQARRTVAGRAESADDARLLLDMLGLSPAPPAPSDRPKRASRATKPRPARVLLYDECRGGCGRRLRPMGMPPGEAPATVTHYQGGLCRTCYRHTHRAGG